MSVVKELNVARNKRAFPVPTEDRQESDVSLIHELPVQDVLLSPLSLWNETAIWRGRNPKFEPKS
jgi:hypothetical protein